MSNTQSLRALMIVAGGLATATTGSAALATAPCGPSTSSYSSRIDRSGLEDRKAERAKKKAAKAAAKKAKANACAAAACGAAPCSAAPCSAAKCGAAKCGAQPG